MAVPTTGYPRAEPLHGDGAKRTTISIHQGKGGARRKERDASEDATGNRAALRADGTGGRSKDPGPEEPSEVVLPRGGEETHRLLGSEAVAPGARVGAGAGEGAAPAEKPPSLG